MIAEKELLAHDRRGEKHDIERLVAEALGYHDFIRHGRNGTMARHPRGNGHHQTIPRSYQGPTHIAELWCGTENTPAGEVRRVELTCGSDVGDQWVAVLYAGSQGAREVARGAHHSAFHALAIAILRHAKVVR